MILRARTTQIVDIIVHLPTCYHWVARKEAEKVSEKLKLNFHKWKNGVIECTKMQFRSSEKANSGTKLLLLVKRVLRVSEMLRECRKKAIKLWNMLDNGNENFLLPQVIWKFSNRQWCLRTASKSRIRKQKNLSRAEIHLKTEKKLRKKIEKKSLRVNFPKCDCVCEREYVWAEVSMFHLEKIGEREFLVCMTCERICT